MDTKLTELLQKCRSGYPAVMGILNVTPDSFSDGGDFVNSKSAIARAEQMIAQGADIIDIGAESTRPGSSAVSSTEQIARIEGCLGAVCSLGAAVSIDTTSSEVAEFALNAGAAIINDISAGMADKKIFDVAAKFDCGLVLMHMQGKPRTMQNAPKYRDVVTEVKNFLAERLNAAYKAGVKAENCIIDPGIGFGKLLEHNLALLANTDKLCSLGAAVLMGASRKRFIGQISGCENAKDRLGGSLAAICKSYLDGARIFRVHDVAESRQLLDVTAAIMQSEV